MFIIYKFSFPKILYIQLNISKYLKSFYIYIYTYINIYMPHIYFLAKHTGKHKYIYLFTVKF